MKISSLFNNDSVNIVPAAIMSEKTKAQGLDLENWMRDLPQQLKDMPIIYLAIPGSHDTMTYGITKNSKVAPDMEKWLRPLHAMLKGTFVRWSKTQSLDAYEQLRAGVRYMDLRVATKRDRPSELFFTHGLYADEITEPLLQVKSFLDSHPNEVVILDFQHFYEFQPDHHRMLKWKLMDLFRAKMVMRPSNLEAVSLASMNRLRQQVILVYREDEHQSSSELWQSGCFPSPWPRQDTTAGLVRFLDGARRPSAKGYVHQAILTPTAGFILARLTSGILQKCAIPVKNEVLPILREFIPGPIRSDGRSPVNIVIADFIELDNAIFCRSIVELNYKLLGYRG